MYKFKNLIINEFVKMYRSKIAVVCLIILAAWVLLGSLSGSFVDYEEYQYGIEDMIEDYRVQLEYETDEVLKQEIQYEISYLTFLMENDLYPDGWREEENVYRDYYALKTSGDATKELLARYEAYFAKDGYRAFATDVLAEPNLDKAIRYRYETVLKYNIDPDDVTDFRNVLLHNVVYDMQVLAEYETIGEKTERVEDLKNQIAIAKYRIENNICTDVQSIIDGENYGEDRATFWGTMYNGTSYMVLLGILCIVIAGRSVACEFGDGTYKLLVLNPVKRGKILFAKYASVLLYGLLLGVVILLLTAIMGALRYGSTMADLLVQAENGVADTTSPLWHLLLLYLNAGVQVLMMTTISFMMSSLFRSQAVAIGFSLVGYLMGSAINAIFYSLSLDFGRFMFFANWDLITIYEGKGNYVGQSLPFALVVLVVHLFVFLLTAYDAFVKREL